MSKFNKFCEKYEVALWISVAAIWFFIEYFCNNSIQSLLGDGIFWTIFAIFEFIRIARKDKSKDKK